MRWILTKSAGRLLLTALDTCAFTSSTAAAREGDRGGAVFSSRPAEPKLVGAMLSLRGGVGL
jgi:hypothetical protein